MSRWLHKETGSEVADLGGFGIIYADNPWQYGDKMIRGGANRHYSTMKTTELCMMPVEKLASPDCALFLWGTWPMMLDAYAVMKAWNFEFKNCGFVWIKMNPVATDTPFVGLGHWSRGNSEFCLLGTKGKPKRIDKAVQQLIYGGEELVVAPIGEHSEKPAEVRNRIVRLLGDDVPAIELFARAPAPGWECFGNQVEATIVLEP